MRQNQGFSLLEISVAMMIIGLIMVPVLEKYSAEQRHKKYELTASRNQNIVAALTEFYDQSNPPRYPCPADPTLGPGDANYGHEVCPGAAGYPANMPTVGFCDAGICRAYAKGSTTETILYGAVPFKELKLPAEQALDAWSRKIAYVVGERASNLNVTLPGAALGPENQAITITTINPADDSTNTTDYQDIALVFSAGPDQVGAYSAEGKLNGTGAIDLPTGKIKSPCFADATLSEGYDTDNCNNDGIYWSTDVGGTAAGQRHYDDISIDIMSTPTHIWRPIPTNTVDSFADFNVGIGTSQVGVKMDATGAVVLGGIELPAYPAGKPVLYDPDGDNRTNIGLDVNGNIRSDIAKTEQICSIDGTNCFKPEALGGTGLIDCKGVSGAEAVMKGVAGGAAKCLDDQGPIVTGGCSGAARVTGFINGNTQCGTP